MSFGRRVRLAVFVSGSGTNLQSMIERSSRGELAAEIVAVISDRPEAYGLERARQAGIAAHCVDYRAYSSLDTGDLLNLDLPVDLKELAGRQKIIKAKKEEMILRRLAGLVLAEQEIIRVLDEYQPDYICLAGFMRLLTPFFLSRYNRHGDWRVVNIHPALLPSFPGQHGYEDTFAYGCKWGGITVHFADEGEDTGPIIAQGVYPIWPEDDLETVRRRGLALEYEIYAQCINWLAAGEVQVRRHADGRFHTKITDPQYPDIIKKWITATLEATYR